MVMRRKKLWIILALAVIVIAGILLVQREPHITPGSFLVVDIGGSYTDEPSTNLVQELIGEQPQHLATLQLELQKVAVDPRLRGVILKITSVDLSFAQVQEIREALQAVQAAGKEVIAWMTGEDVSGNGEYYLASAANKVYVSDNTFLPLLGLQASFIFLGDMWEKLDIDMQVEKMKEYKTFGDFLTRESMSEAHREMANSLLDNLNKQLLSAIAAKRGLTPERVQSLIDAPTLTPEDYHQAGLIDGIRYFDDLLRELGDGGATTVPTVDLATYSRVKATSLGLRRGPKIAVISGVGAITTGRSRWSASGEVMGADTILEAFDEASEDETVTAIVFRIDSPGGSALASDLIWHAVERAKQAKPVVISMSSVAASGGYYVAAGATKIVAHPATLTGSIGIVFSHANVQGLLDKLGINTEDIGRGRYAQLFAASKSWTAAERQQVQRVMEVLYHTFTRKVAVGRALSVEEVDRIGGGRVWTGAQAKEHGLVDALGGMPTALRLAKEAAGIPMGTDPQLVYYPQPQGVFTALLERLRGQLQISSPLPQPLQEAMARLRALRTQEPGPRFTMPVLLRIR
jgi:protease-4